MRHFGMTKRGDDLPGDIRFGAVLFGGLIFFIIVLLLWG